MTDPQQPNHWDLLVSELGATPAPPEPKKPKDKAEPVEGAADQGTRGPASGPKEGKARPAPQRRSRTDWGQLADQLGVERRDEPGAPLPSGAGAVPVHEPAGAFPEPMRAKAAGAPAESADTREVTGRGPSDAAMDRPEPDVLAAEPPAESTRTDLVATGSEVELPGFWAEIPVSAEQRPESTPDRKHRRRRPKSKPARPGEPTGATLAQPATEPGEGLSEGAAAATEDARSGERPNRRRRRGAGRKKAGPGRDAQSAEPPSLLEPAAPGNGKTPQRSPDEAAAASDVRKEPKSAKASGSDKAVHRGIPSWSEAVGIVISANLESRAKRPNVPSSSRGRGGRGRGGRDRSGDQGK